jgi:hypothetical protein
MADPAPITATKKDRGRKNVIVPVVPVVPKAVMSRKERRKSKQIGNAAPEHETATDDGVKADEITQNGSLEVKLNPDQSAKDEASSEKAQPEPPAPSEQPAQSVEAEQSAERQGEYRLH